LTNVSTGNLGLYSLLTSILISSACTGVCSDTSISSSLTHAGNFVHRLSLALANFSSSEYSSPPNSEINFGQNFLGIRMYGNCHARSRVLSTPVHENFFQFIQAINEENHSIPSAHILALNIHLRKVV
jgi:hypothetical protein